MIAASVVRTLLAPSMAAFRRDLRNPRSAQERLLRSIVRRLGRTERGRAYGITAHDTYEAFAEKLPVVTFDELRSWIDRQMAIEGDQLVDEPVLFYQPTSGSTAPSKPVPTTRSLRRAFTHMFALWLHDVLANGPPLQTGRFYFSVSPPDKAGRTPNGVRIGSDSDLEYVRGPLNPLLRRYVVGLDDRPEVVSIWNPSFLLTRVKTPMPSVKLLSCWAGAEAARSIDALRALFPRARIQPKGLLATEAPVTIPMCEAGGFVPLVSDVFIELDDGGRIRRLHEAETGSEYELILSQCAGLVRYRIGDRVRATAPFLGTPCLDFIGRADAVCDLVGEKLSEGFARQVTASVVAGRFGVIVPDRARHGYVVIVDSARGSAEEALLASPRYAEARRNGQLAPARLVVDEHAEVRVLDACEGSGMKRGDVKPDSLIRNAMVAARLAAIYEPDHATALQ